MSKTIPTGQAITVRNPAFCSIEVLYSCMLRCKMCNMWSNKRTQDELSIKAWKGFVLMLKEFTKARSSINITGGEPFLKEDVLSLVRFASGQGFNDISMTTNGYLIDEERSKEIADSGLGMISMSLDSLDEEIHDAVRGIQGAFRKTMHAIDLLNKNKGGLKKIGIQSIIRDPISKAY